MSEALLLGIDVGGSVTKASIFGADGQLRASAGASSEVITTPGGVVERSMDELWAAVTNAIQSCLADPGVDPQQVIAVGVTGFGNGLFLFDADGNPVRNAIAAVDTRARDIVHEWRAAGYESGMHERTLQRFWSGQPLPLLKWLQRFESDALAQASRLVLSKDFVRFRLTGSLSAERSDLGSAGLWDPVAQRVPHELFAELGLPEVGELFDPEQVLEPTDIAGEISAEAAAQTGLPQGIPVAAGTLDGLAGMLGSGVTQLHHLSIMSGTWGIQQVFSPAKDPTGELFQSLTPLESDRFLLVESTPNSMSNFDWFLRNLYVGNNGELTSDDYAELDRVIASTSLAKDDPLTFIPHVYSTPRNPSCSGSLSGLTADATPERLVRAVCEGVVFEHRVLIERLAGVDWTLAPVLSGGATKSAAWPQLFADILGAPIATPDTSELGARGAVMLAAVATELYPDLATAADAMTNVGRQWDPREDQVETLHARFETYQSQRAAALSQTQPK